MMRLATNFWGFNRVHAWLWRNIPLANALPSLPDEFEIINNAHLMNGAANRSPIHTNCLQRSLTLWCLLRRIGVASELRIGVDTQHGVFRAHAWLEKNGVVLTDSPNSVQHFTPFEQAIEPIMFDTL